MKELLELFLMINIAYFELLMTKKEHTIHQQNINILMKKIYKFENNLSAPLIDDMFQVPKINSNLRQILKKNL